MNMLSVDNSYEELESAINYIRQQGIGWHINDSHQEIEQKISNHKESMQAVINIWLAKIKAEYAPHFSQELFDLVYEQMCYEEGLLYYDGHRELLIDHIKYADKILRTHARNMQPSDRATKESIQRQRMLDRFRGRNTKATQDFDLIAPPSIDD